MSKYYKGYWIGALYKSHFNGMAYRIFDKKYDEGNVFVNVQWDNGETSGDWEWGNFISHHYDETVGEYK